MYQVIEEMNGEFGQSMYKINVNYISKLVDIFLC